MKKLYTIILLAFVCTIANAQYTKLYNCDTINGMNPHDDLYSDGTFLYGMTEAGGANGDGVIFKIKPDGTGYVKLLDFAGVSNGSNPYGSLISDGTYLYGMTYAGGTSSNGVIFKIKPDGTKDTVLFNFAGGTDGEHPYGSLISDGTYLYGMTAQGGSTFCGGCGTIFKIKLNGTGYSQLFAFSGIGINGYNPASSLIYDGTFLYGMTNKGGTNNEGTIFKIMPDGTGYDSLMCFRHTTNGGQPCGSLISDGTFLYGMAQIGGIGGEGVVFKIKPDGTGYATLHDFALILIDGAQPYGSLMYDGTYLYGMTEFSSGGFGVIFKIKPDGTGYTVLYNFAGGTDGKNPGGSLISDGTFLYGMTTGGGTNADGIIFKYYPYCSNLSTSLTLMQDTANPLLWYGYDTITGGTAPYTYLWNFGDGDTSNLPNPSHTYSVSGHYAVGLTVTDANGCTTSVVDSTYRIQSPGIMQYLNVVFTATQNLQNINNFTISPNPSNGVFKIQMDNGKSSIENSQLSIYNVFGECIYRQTFNSTNQQIDLSSQPNGIYFVQLKTEQGIISKKIIITK